MRRRLQVLSLACAALLRAAPALADAGPELRSRLVYSAPSTCPGEEHFLTLLAQHSEVVIDDAAPLELRIEVKKDERRYRGRVAVVATEQEGVREVVADRCEDVVRGLALFSAIALDAYFERRAKEEPRSPAHPPRTTDSLPVPEEPARARTPAPGSAPLPSRRLPRPAAATSFGVGLGQQGAVGTRPLYFVGVFGELELPRTPHTAIRASALAGAVVPQSYGEGTLSFGMGWLRLELCPVRVVLARTLLASVCPAGELGLQRAALEGTAGGRSEVRLWLAAGGIGRLRTQLGHMVELEASAGALAPLRPFDFRTQAGVAYATPSVAPVVELDVIVTGF